MQIQRAFQYEAKPTPVQQQAFALQFGHARFAYNATLALRQSVYQQYKKSLSYEETTKQLTLLKNHPDFAWLKQAHSQVLQQALKNQANAFKHFFAGHAKYPRFKSKHDKQSIRFPQGFKLRDQHVYLPKVGLVKLLIHRPFVGIPKSVTVSKTKSGRYLVSVLCEIEIEATPNGLPSVRIDVGSPDFAKLSTDEKIPIPAPLRKAERKRKRLRKQLERKQKDSNNRKKLCAKLAKLAEHTTNQRKDFDHKESKRLVSSYGKLIFERKQDEETTPQNPKTQPLPNTGWTQFIRFCEYKGVFYGCEVIKGSNLS
ncbi:MAG: transposase [Myxococcales bacterium]|nr:transposase [Myxococcales bacterium]